MEIRAYNSSSAYELEKRVRTETVKEKAPIRLKVIERQRASSIADRITLKSVLIFLFIVGVICLMLYNQAQINEVNNEIGDVKADIEQLKSEYTQMHSGLESTITVRSVALKAEQELGLQPLDQYKTVYLRIYEEDQVNIISVEEEQSMSEHVETFVTNIVQRIKSTFESE